MPRYFDCPYLGGQVELTGEREAYILVKHDDIVVHDLRFVAETLRDPDLVLLDLRSRNTRALTRWYDDLKGGKHAVVVVVTDSDTARHWIVTAFVARRVSKRDLEWERV